MADTSFEFSHLSVPASRYMKELNYSNQTPLSGMRKNQKMQSSPMMEPAGKRVPTEYLEE